MPTTTPKIRRGIFFREPSYNLTSAPKSKSESRRNIFQGASLSFRRNKSSKIIKDLTPRRPRRPGLPRSKRPPRTLHQFEYGGKTSTPYWWYAIFIFSVMSLLICLLQVFLPPPFGFRMTSSEIEAIGIAPDGCEDGLERCICPRETICATSKISIALLALARCSAFFDYPLYMMMFLSKAHNINNILRRTVLREWIDFADMHKIHSIFGIVVGIETMFHSFFHMLRWGLNNSIHLLWDTNTGITGLVAATATPLIVWPMVIPALKERLRFEVRKGLHYLSWVWAITLMWHAPSRIYYLIGMPALIYLLDFFVGLFIRNHLIDDVYFERYGENGVALHFKNPKKYDTSKTSYVYIMVPWISKYQWHAFTMFPEPNIKDHTMLCVGNSGDWTGQLFDKIRAPCHRPVYVIGPYMSEFSDAAVGSTNVIAIASGIGITPILSLMHSFAGKKRVNVVWMCRDPGLIEYFLHKVDFPALTQNSFVIIFYTGKRELCLPKDLPITVLIFRQRPKLEETISGILAAIHSGEGLPEKMFKDQKALLSLPFNERIKVAFSRVVEIYGAEEMFNFAVKETEKELKEAQRVDDGSNERTSETVLLLDSVTEELGDDISSEINDLESVGNIIYANEDVAENVVSLRGLEKMIAAFLGGVGEYSDKDIENLLKQVDTDESGYIDEDEFDIFLAMAMREENESIETKVRKVLDRGASLRTLHPSRSLIIDSHQPSSLSIDVTFHRDGAGTMVGDKFTIEYMEKLVCDIEKPLDDWSLFYCGGSTSTKNTLKGIKQKYKMKLAVEKFDW